MNNKKENFIASVSVTLGEEYGEDYIISSIGGNINISIIVSPSLTIDDLFYFKIFNHEFIPKSDKCCRISLLEPKYIYVKDKNIKKEFELNDIQKKILVEELNKPFHSEGKLNNIKINTRWKYLIFRFNEIRKRNNPLLTLLDYDIPIPDYTKLTI